ncbi:unnamed protein product [Cylindrotheca closterium]|uniref:Uncharacterized protein n=1 Tax=Cylindrotheca closterium TaxID=2856 RepID=A0AAD2CIV0_9STRA|nr:unnamed protein product [Cylindrotheca closterium]
MVFKKFWKKIKRSRSKQNLFEQEQREANANTADGIHSDDDVTLTTNDRENSGNIVFELDYLEKDALPEFDDIPEDDYSTDSEDEAEKKDDLEYQMLAQKYSTKEDQDVAVFIAVADRMTMSSMLHILQGHVRSCNMDVQKFAELAKTQDHGLTSQLKSNAVSFAKPRPKKCRFAEVTDGQVRANVKEVECLKTMKGLWWKPTEMRTIQEELVETVLFFRRYRHDYIESVEVIAQKSDVLPEEVVEKHLKNLTKDNYTRGLEAHIVKLLSQNRKTTVHAVMKKQKKLTKESKNDPETLNLLREQSLESSQLSTRFAEKMGQCDEIIALKASLSAW